jgi:hypothetical protein
MMGRHGDRMTASSGLSDGFVAEGPLGQDLFGRRGVLGRSDHGVEGWTLHGPGLAGSPQRRRSGARKARQSWSAGEAVA